MLFSFVVPAFNSGSTIRPCLDSILAQTYDDYEVIIINDGSIDDTAKICYTYAKKYENFRMYYQQNSGVAVSRRKGVELANGDYIIFVDSDDSINPDLLWNLANAINENPDLDIIRYQANLINDESYKNHERHNFMSEINSVHSGLESLKLWTGSSIKYALYWLFAFKKSLFSKIAFPDLRCYEDVAYIPLLITLAQKVITIDYRGYNYTCNRGDSLTNSISLEHYRKRATNFYNACKFATNNFAKLPGVTKEDINFFNADYDRRLKGFYSGIPEELKNEFKELYGISS